MIEQSSDAIPEMYTAYAFYLERRREERRKWMQELDERKREVLRNSYPIMNDVFGPILYEAMKEQMFGKRPVVKETLAVDRSVPTPGWSMMRR